MSDQESEQQLFDPGPPIIVPAKTPEPRAKIHIDLDGSYVFEEKDLWPDGDAPEGWTAKDAKELISNYGLEKFGLLDELDMTVYVADSPDERKYA
jgi:hypothetical protein